MSTPLLAMRDVSVEFGGVKAVNGLDLHVSPNEVLGIIGPNGAGKTTLFNALTGVIRPNSGEIEFDGRAIAGLLPREVARRGLIRTFQITSIFPELTVAENVTLAAQSEHGVLGALLSPSRRKAVASRAQEIIELLELEAIAGQLVSELSYGDQRVVEIALGMACRPKLLLLDEPTAGMSPSETTALTRLVKRIRSTVTVIIIEHDMEVIADVADRICVLNFGQLVAEGTLAQIRADQHVRDIYLGAGTC